MREKGEDGGRHGRRVRTVTLNNTILLRYSIINTKLITNHKIERRITYTLFIVETNGGKDKSVREKRGGGEGMEEGLEQSH